MIPFLRNCFARHRFLLSIISLFCTSKIPIESKTPQKKLIVCLRMHPREISVSDLICCIRFHYVRNADFRYVTAN